MAFGHLDRTKTLNGSGNGSKNGSSKLKICSPSGRGKSFHGCGLASSLVTSMSMQVSLLTPPCASTTGKQNPTVASWSRSQTSALVYHGGLGMRLDLVRKVIPVILNTALSQNYTIGG